MSTTGSIRHVTTYLCADGASDAIDFYKEAFGAEERSRMTMDDGRIGHAEIAIGDTTLFVSDEWAEHRVLSPHTLNGNSTSFVMFVSELDAAWKRALDAGATVEREITDAPHGRGGWIVDPFGHRWNLMTPASQP